VPLLETIQVGGTEAAGVERVFQPHSDTAEACKGAGPLNLAFFLWALAEGCRPQHNADIKMLPEKETLWVGQSSTPT